MQDAPPKLRPLHRALVCKHAGCILDCILCSVFLALTAYMQNAPPKLYPLQYVLAVQDAPSKLYPLQYVLAMTLLRMPFRA